MSDSICDEYSICISPTKSVGDFVKGCRYVAKLINPSTYLLNLNDNVYLLPTQFNVPSPHLIDKSGVEEAGKFMLVRSDCDE